MKALRFSEPRNGWMEIVLIGDKADHTVVASAVPNDCVRDFVQAMIRILSGSAVEQVRFSLEPDYATFYLQRGGSGIHVSILEPRGDNPVFELVFPVVAFAKRLAFECKRIQPACGKAATWTWEYPAREVEHLVAAAQNADGAADGSQPIRSETNRTPSAAGSRR